MMLALTLALVPAASPQGLPNQLAPAVLVDGARYGQALALDGDRAVVGAFNHQNGGIREGSAFVHRFVGATWVLEQELVHPNPAPTTVFSDEYGAAVDLEGEWAIVGAPMDDVSFGSNDGSAYVFRRVGSSWTYVQRLGLSVLGNVGQFGRALDLHGGVLAVGAPFANGQTVFSHGKVVIFEASGGLWAETAELFLAAAQRYDQFGRELALGDDWLAVSAGRSCSTQYPNSCDSPSRIVIFDRAGGQWTQATELMASDGESQDEFGTALAAEGDTLVAGAPRDHVNGLLDVGSAYVFERGPTGSWTEVQKLTAPVPSAGELFGTDVALAGDRLIVTAPWGGVPWGAGTCYEYRRVAGAWTFTGRVRPANAEVYGSFGVAAAVNAAHLLVGAGRGTLDRPTTGSVHVFGPATPPAPFAEPYCFCPVGVPCNDALLDHGCENQTGRGAWTRIDGSPSVAADDLRIRVVDMPAGSVGLLVMGGASTVLRLGDGQLCVAGGSSGSYRFAPATADAAGQVTYGPGLVASSAAAFGPAGTIAPGTTWHFQHWYRDPVGPRCSGFDVVVPRGFNLSSALAVTFTP